MARDADVPKKNQFYALASIAIILAMLYFGQEVLVPLALAVLFAFLLAPLVARLERLNVGRVISTLLVVVVALSVIGALGWTVERRFVQIVDKLPEYRDAIHAKFARLTRSGGVVEKVRQEIKQTIEVPATQAAETTQPATQSATQPATEPGGPATGSPPTGSPAAAPTVAIQVHVPPGDAAAPAGGLTKPTPEDPWPVRLYPKPASGLEVTGQYLGRFLGPLATAGLVLVFVIFMLLSREDLRDRLIRLVGDNSLHATTQALDDAATRVSRFLLAQSLINASFGVAVALGLWLIDLTLGGRQAGFLTAVVAGLLCGVLRFVPYVGTWIGAALPLGLAFAAYSGNGVFFATLAMFVVIELVISQVIEPNLLGSSTGLSPIAVLVSAVFWTWMWGTVGLLLSMPLTVILVVMGKYVPQLAFLDVLLGDTPVLDPHTRVYQRLIACDDEEAAELAAEYLDEMPLEAVYDTVLIPALAQAELDRHRGRLDEARHASVRQGIRDITESLADRQRDEDVSEASDKTVREAKGEAADAPGKPASGKPSANGHARRILPKGTALDVLCLPAKSEADEIVGLMLARLLERRGYRVTAPGASALTSEMVGLATSSKADVVVVSALPPKAALNVRYVLKRVTARNPGLGVVAGLWKNTRDLAKTGIGDFAGVRVVTTLAEAQDRLDELVPAVATTPAADDRRARPASL
jgi:predicted PurR-regulated permease PerM/methylmalonyl-CoA mutase cobalamin-binding subunit